LRLLLLTGCRLREILNLRWEEFDRERGMLLLPESKTGRKPVVLSAAAAASFLACFLDFFVVVPVVVSVELGAVACAFAKVGEMAITSARLKANSHRKIFFWQ